MPPQLQRKWLEEEKNAKIGLENAKSPYGLYLAAVRSGRFHGVFKF
jgi:hypothetical protein